MQLIVSRETFGRNPVPFLGTMALRGLPFSLCQNSAFHVESCYFAPFFPPNFPPHMAHFERRGDSWRASVERRGVRKSATFPSKAAAVAWAGRVEADIMAGYRGEVPNKTFGDLLDRYSVEVSPHKKGHRWESIRITLVKRDRIAQERLRTLSAVHVAEWRDRRLQAVSAPSVRREWNLLSHACNIAVREWKWLAVNPFKEVRRPKSAQPRQRVFTDADLEKLDQRATSPERQQVMRIVRFAIETGMRASEICGLREIAGRVARLHDTKNGTARDVPLSEKAVELFGDGFTITPGSLDTIFRHMRDEAGIQGLHFHDTRHTACTNLSRKLNVLQLQRMLGIKDPRILAVYFNESAEDVAKLL